jgi:hypothetical protein
MNTFKIFKAARIAFSVGMASIFTALPIHTVHADTDSVALNDQMVLQLALTQVSPTNLIEWKVGDTMNYEINMGGFPLGTNIKSVTKDEGTAIWMRQDMKLMSQNEVVEALINKADGKLLKMIRNGQEQSIPDNDIEIISQDATEIKVKAGTFKAIHIVAKSKEIERIEMWANPRDTAIDGTIKQMVKSQMGMISFELTAFKRIP